MFTFFSTMRSQCNNKTATILTVTPNPAIDQTITLDALVPGQVHRAVSATANAGGKGVNVSSCLADWNQPTLATGFLGTGNTGLFEELCQTKDIADRFIRVKGMTRTNIKIVDSSGTTDINLPGAETSEKALAEFMKALDAMPTADLAVLAGSLPPGCPVGLYRDLIEYFSRNGTTRTILDADGMALAEAMLASTLPYCIKPNKSELAELMRKDLNSVEEVVSEARRLRERGVGMVVVSMGEEGAVFVDASGAVLARGEVKYLKSTVGAGDAMVAGVTAALAEDAGLERVARLATAFSVGKLSCIGPNLPGLVAVETIAEQVTLKTFGRG